MAKSSPRCGEAEGVVPFPQLHSTRFLAKNEKFKEKSVSIFSIRENDTEKTVSSIAGEVEGGRRICRENVLWESTMEFKRGVEVFFPLGF